MILLSSPFVHAQKNFCLKEKFRTICINHLQTRNTLQYRISRFQKKDNEKKWLKLSPKWLHELRVTTYQNHQHNNPHTQIVTKYISLQRDKGTQLKHVTQNITSRVDNFNPKCSSAAMHYINFKIGCQKQSFLSCKVAFSHVLRGSSLCVETAPNCQVSKLEFLQNF